MVSLEERDFEIASQMLSCSVEELPKSLVAMITDALELMRKVRGYRQLGLEVVSSMVAMDRRLSGSQVVSPEYTSLDVVHDRLDSMETALHTLVIPAIQMEDDPKPKKTSGKKSDS